MEPWYQKIGDTITLTIYVQLGAKHNDGGRGLYFNDQNGHFLEIITRPYGGGEE